MRYTTEIYVLQHVSAVKYTCDMRQVKSGWKLQCVHNSTIHYTTLQCGHNSTVQYSTVQYSTVQYSTVQYSAVQYSTVLYSAVQYSTVQCKSRYCVSPLPLCRLRNLWLSVLVRLDCLLWGKDSMSDEKEEEEEIEGLWGRYVNIEILWSACHGFRWRK